METTFNLVFQRLNIQQPDTLSIGNPALSRIRILPVFQFEQISPSTYLKMFISIKVCNESKQYFFCAKLKSFFFLVDQQFVWQGKQRSGKLCVLMNKGMWYLSSVFLIQMIDKTVFGQRNVPGNTVYSLTAWMWYLQSVSIFRCQTRLFWVK